MASKNKAGKSKKPEPVSEEDTEEDKVENPPKGVYKRVRRGKSSERQEDSKDKGGKNSKNSKTKPKEPSDDEDDDKSDGEYRPPKRNLSGYVFFSKENREIEAKKYPDLAGKDMMGHLGKLWKKCSASEKAPYDKMAVEDKKRYERQVEEYENEGRFYDENGKVVKIPIKKKRSISKKKVEKSPMEKKKRLKKKN
jgi:structure-specific recognition protein 1